MKILLAEDERDILYQYMQVLGNTHQVTATTDGEACLKAYVAEMQEGVTLTSWCLITGCPSWMGWKSQSEYSQRPPQAEGNIRFSLRQGNPLGISKAANQVVELLQKPFDLDTLVDTIEDKEIYEKLADLNVKVQEIKNLNPTHKQVQVLLEGLTKLRKARAP